MLLFLGSLPWVCFLLFFVDDDSDQLLFLHLCFLAKDKQTGQQHSKDYALLCVGFVLASFLLGLALCMCCCSSLLMMTLTNCCSNCCSLPPALRSADAP